MISILEITLIGAIVGRVDEHWRNGMRRAGTWTGIGLAALLLVGACSSTSDGSGSAGTASDAPACPTDPVKVVVTVNQWADIVSSLAGRCAQVTTVIKGSDVDPHDYEPTPSDNAEFLDADLVVMNGLGYDEWAAKVVRTLSPRPPVVDAGEVAGLTEGDNPHVWYSPTYVPQVAAAVTTELGRLLPGTGSYLSDRATEWAAAAQPYLDEVAAIRTVAGGKTYAATESVFDDMATAVGLVDRTPEGYRNAAANESEPSPADINAFEQLLRDKQVDVLIVNTQTEGSVPARLRSVAENAGVPIVEVTESVPPGQSSFVGWQLDQLTALRTALGA
jgi:zinc/manganese transport system substrate-binding protein